MAPQFAAPMSNTSVLAKQQKPQNLAGLTTDANTYTCYLDFTCGTIAFQSAVFWSSDYPCLPYNKYREIPWKSFPRLVTQVTNAQ